MTNNPNEGPASELNVSGTGTGSEAEQRSNNIQVGSRDLRLSSNEVSRYTNTQLDEYEQELLNASSAQKQQQQQ